MCLLMSDIEKENIIRTFAFHNYQIRMRLNLPGDETQDWIAAEKTINKSYLKEAL